MPDNWEYPWYAAWDHAFHMIPFARPRSWIGNQRDSARESVGNAPASAAPNTVRVTSIVVKLRARPVKIVKIDQQPTMRMSIRR